MPHSKSTSVLLRDPQPMREECSSKMHPRAGLGGLLGLSFSQALLPYLTDGWGRIGLRPLSARHGAWCLNLDTFDISPRLTPLGTAHAVKAQGHQAQGMDWKTHFLPLRVIVTVEHVSSVESMLGAGLRTL